jgi:CheY-like chemotaxis protein
MMRAGGVDHISPARVFPLILRRRAIPAPWRRMSGFGAARTLGGRDMAKILIIEDNEMNRDMLARRLRRKGFEVAIAVDGESGLEVAAGEKPDLILMDMSLPGINGWEATRKLKSAPGTAAIPVVALTAHAMAGDREKALEAGCDDYETKPVDLTLLLTKIQRLLPPGPG